VKILLATDGSKYSEAAAQFVAKQFRSQDHEIRVLSVVEPISTAPISQMSPGYYPELEGQKREAKALAEQTAKALAAAGFRVSASVAAGDAKCMILDEAAEWPCDLIVVGSHGHKGLERFLLGSVSEAVAHHASCSVVIVRG
jgi:nucleotide-binding universal stress UspA family protein